MVDMDRTNIMSHYVGESLNLGRFKIQLILTKIEAQVIKYVKDWSSPCYLDRLPYLVDAYVYSFQQRLTTFYIWLGQFMYLKKTCN